MPALENFQVLISATHHHTLTKLLPDIGCQGLDTIQDWAWQIWILLVDYYPSTTTKQMVKMSLHAINYPTNCNTVNDKEREER